MKSLRDKIVYATETNDLGYLFKVAGLKKEEVNAKILENEDTLFMWAIKNRKWAVVERLLQNKELDLNATNAKNETALHAMVNLIISRDGVSIEDKKKCGALIKHFIARKGVDVNIQDQNGQTPWLVLFDQFTSKDVSIDEYQVIDNAENLFADRDDLAVNLQDNRQLSGLMMTGLNKKYALTEKLMKKGADVNIVDEEGNNIFMQATNLGNEILADLILSDKNLNLNAVNRYNETALHIALKKPYCKEKVDIAKKLIAREEVNVNARDDAGNAPIITAYKNAQKEVFEKLLARQDIDLNIVGSENENLLMIAVERGDAKLVYQILGRPGVDINAFDNAKENVVMKAIKSLEKNGEMGYAILKVLLAHPDLDINAAASQGGRGNALTTAISVKNDKVIDMILARDEVDIDRPFNYAAVDTALRTGNLSLLYRLTDHKCFDAKDEDFNGSNAVGHFLEKTVSTVTPEVFETISTDLLDACKQEEIEELLNHQNKFGDNALMSAVKAGASAKVVKSFLNDVVRHFGLVNIDFDAVNINGESLKDLIATQPTTDKSYTVAKVIDDYKVYCEREGFQHNAEVVTLEEEENKD